MLNRVLQQIRRRRLHAAIRQKTWKRAVYDLILRMISILTRLLRRERAPKTEPR